MKTSKEIVDEFIELSKRDSIDNIEELKMAMQVEFPFPVKEDPPGDTREFITDLYIRNSGDPVMVYMRFSKWGNMCEVSYHETSMVSPEKVAQMLTAFGWRIVSDEESGLIVFTDAYGTTTVGDIFFRGSC